MGRKMHRQETRGRQKLLEKEKEREREVDHGGVVGPCGFLGLPRRIDTNFRCSCLLQTRVSLPFSFVFARARVCVRVCVLSTTRRESICIDVRHPLLLSVRVIRKNAISNVYIIMSLHYVVASYLHTSTFAF